MNPKADRLLPYPGVACERLGVSPDTYVRRESDPFRFPNWPKRSVVGYRSNGQPIYVVRESIVTAYINTLPVVEPKPHDEAQAELGRLGGAASKAKRTAVKSQTESELREGEASKAGSDTRNPALDTRSMPAPTTASSAPSNPAGSAAKKSRTRRAKTTSE